MKNKYLIYLIYFLFPFSSIILFVRFFNYKIVKFLFIGFFAFAGFTANSSGDIKFYANIIDNYSSALLLQNLFDKPFIYITAYCLQFLNSNFYLSFLFSFFAYFLISSIKLFQEKKILFNNLNLSFTLLILVTSFFTWNLFNYAFFTGCIFFTYFTIQYIKTNKFIFIVFVLLSPIFHFSLLSLVFLFFAFIILKERFYVCLALLIASYFFNVDVFHNTFSQSSIFTFLDLDHKFDAYVSDFGVESSRNNYATSYEKANSNFRFFNDLRDLNFTLFMPLLSLLIILNRKLFVNDILLKRLLNLSILLLTLFNIINHFPEGFRFGYIYSFITIGIYFLLLQRIKFKSINYKLILIVLPIILINNLINLYVSLNLFSINFLFSNYFIEILFM